MRSVEGIEDLVVAMNGCSHSDAAPPGACFPASRRSPVRAQRRVNGRASVARNGKGPGDRRPAVCWTHWQLSALPQDAASYAVALAAGPRSAPGPVPHVWRVPETDDVVVISFDLFEESLSSAIELAHQALFALISI